MWPILLVLAGQDPWRLGGGQWWYPSPPIGCAALSLHAELDCSGEVVVVGAVEAPWHGGGPHPGDLAVEGHLDVLASEFTTKK